MAFGGTTFNTDVIGDCVDSRIEDGFVAVDLFYGFCRSTNKLLPPCDILRNCSESRGVFPQHLLPIASCPYGNQLALSIKGEKSDSLYFIDHEEFGGALCPSEELQDGIYLVNRSFSQFIDSLRSFDT